VVAEPDEQKRTVLLLAGEGAPQESDFIVETASPASRPGISGPRPYLSLDPYMPDHEHANECQVVIGDMEEARRSRRVRHKRFSR